MKINFDQPMMLLEPAPVMDEKGKPVMDGDRPVTRDYIQNGERNEPLTLGIVTARALLNVQPDGQKDMAAEEKILRWDLARRVIAGGEQSIKPEGAATMKAAVNEVWGVAVAGQALPMLDGE